MGLLEKALKFKRELNRKGEETLIDRIKGPADTKTFDDLQQPGIESGEIPAADTIARKRKLNVTRDADLPGIDQSDGDADMVLLNTSDLVEVSDSDIDGEVLEAQGRSRGSGIDEGESEGVISGGPEKIEVKKNIPRKTGVPGVHEKESGKSGAVSSLNRILEEGANRDLPAPQYEGSFKDFMVLYETGREIIRSTTRNELFDTLIFLIMGQIGVSSVSIMIPDLEVERRWVIAESRGVTIDENFFFDSATGILGSIHERREILDIEEFGRGENFKDDYLAFISIDARLLVPMMYHGAIVGIVVVGNKISTEDFADEEKDYLHSVSQFASLTYYTLLVKDINKIEVDKLYRNISDSEEVDKLQDQMFAKDDFDDAKVVIREELGAIGVEIYSFFMLHEFNNKYIPFMTEQEDFLSVMDVNFSISVKNTLIGYIGKAKSPIVIDDFKTFDALGEIYSKSQINKMSLLRIYPFRIGSNLVGFIAVFKIADESRMQEIDSKLIRISDIVFPYLISLENVHYTKRKYVDTVEYVLNRIDEEIRKAKNLGIPLTLVQFSIKNFKRYYSMHGVEKAQHLMNQIENLVKGRLSDVDFSVRHDRNKILIVLPGKDKEYAVPMAHTLKNEIIHSFSSKDVQLLVTFLTSEFPKDGEHLYSLIDTIE